MDALGTSCYYDIKCTYLLIYESEILIQKSEVKRSSLLQNCFYHHVPE